MLPFEARFQYHLQHSFFNYCLLSALKHEYYIVIVTMFLLLQGISGEPGPKGQVRP